MARLSSSTVKRSRFTRRARVVLTNTVNDLVRSVFYPLVSLLVIRLASVEFWGSFVHVMIVMQFGAHVISWGNKEYLLREFSRHPAEIFRDWQSSLLTRLALLPVLAVVFVIMGFVLTVLVLLVFWSSGRVLYEPHNVLILL